MYYPPWELSMVVLSWRIEVTSKKERIRSFPYTDGVRISTGDYSLLLKKIRI